MRRSGILEERGGVIRRIAVMIAEAATSHNGKSPAAQVVEEAIRIADAAEGEEAGALLLGFRQRHRQTGSPQYRV